MEIILTNILKVMLILFSFAVTYGICRFANARTKQIERVSQWKRTEERETQWYDLSDISDFELDSPRL